MGDNYTTELYEFTAKLNAFLMERFGYKLPLGSASLNRTIFLQRAKVQVYIRYRINKGIWEQETLVIAYFHFQQERRGHGTALLRFITDHCIDHGIKYIGIERTNEKSATFALKYGFHEIEEKECYLVAVEDLHRKLINIL